MSGLSSNCLYSKYRQRTGLYNNTEKIQQKRLKPIPYMGYKGFIDTYPRAWDIFQDLYKIGDAVLFYKYISWFYSHVERWDSFKTCLKLIDAVLNRIGCEAVPVEALKAAISLASDELHSYQDAEIEIRAANLVGSWGKPPTV